MILTDKEKMIVTPTYHVFEMYKLHQDAVLLPVHVDSPGYAVGDEEIPAISVSASRRSEGGRPGAGASGAAGLGASGDAAGDAGYITISLCNLDPGKSHDVFLELRGAKASKVTGRVLTAPAMNARNTFENPEAVKPAEFREASVAPDGGSIETTLPPMSIVVLKVE